MNSNGGHPHALPPSGSGESQRPARVEVDLGRVEENARRVKRLIGPGCELMAVVKADGYGLGAPFIGSAAIQGGATRLGVACVDEGVVLREAGIEVPILVMGYIAPEEAERAVLADLTVVVALQETVDALESSASKLSLPSRSVRVHAKVDTGLHRYGCLPSGFFALLERIAACPHLLLEGLMTHFSTADSEDLTFAREQLALFEQVKQEAARRGYTFEVVHAANSAATLALPESRYSMVRVGIMLAGNHPAPHLRPLLPLLPAVTWKSCLARVSTIEAGDSVGYGRTWVAQRRSVIGLVPVGYADGYRRVFSNRAEVLVQGKRCPVVGRISMDQITVDLTGLPHAAEGEEVVLMGSQGDACVSPDELGAWADTISYEILTGLARRLPRRYTGVDRAVISRLNTEGAVR